MIARNYVGSDVVDVSLSPDTKVSLDHYINDSKSIPLTIFQSSTIDKLAAIPIAINYLREKREGVVEIPAESNQKAVYLEAKLDKLNRVKINYKTSNYRYPINQESRPYSNEAWDIGDIVFNSDVSDQKCLGWICIESGIPGNWLGFGYIKRWFTELERVENLPQPGAMQEGRQLIANGRIYTCKLMNGEYDWYWMDYTYGNTAQRPSDNLKVGMPYFNTETRLPEWYDGSSWVAVATEASLAAKGASDSPSFSSIKSTKSEILFLNDASGGFLQNLHLIANANHGDYVSILSLQNYMNLNKLELASSYLDSVTVSRQSMTIKSKANQPSALVAKLVTNARILDPTYTVSYHHDEISTNGKFCKIRITTEDSKASILIDSNEGEISGNKRSIGVSLDIRKFNSNDNLIIEYLSPETSSQAFQNQLDNISLVQLAPHVVNFSTNDYLDSSLSGSSKFLDEYHDQGIVTRRVEYSSLVKRNDNYDLLNQASLSSDNFILIEYDNTFSKLGQSSYLPSNDDTVAEDLASYYSEFSLVTYNQAKLGSNSNKLLALSSTGKLLISLPKSMFTRDLEKSAIRWLEESVLATLEIPIPNKSPRIILTKPATPIRLYPAGVLLIDNPSSQTVEFEYATNSAAAALTNTKVLELIVTGKLQTRLTSSSDRSTWDSLARLGATWGGV